MKFHVGFTAVLGFCVILDVDSMQKPPMPELAVPPLGRRTIDCDGTDKSFPGDMMLINNKVLWCPTSTCATTTIFRRLSEQTALPQGVRCYQDHPVNRCNYKRLKTIAMVPKKDLCKASTYVWVRNPWDRIASEYLDKIETGSVDPWTTHPVPGIPSPSGTPTFAEFVRFVYAQKKQNQTAMNRKWMPASHRCMANKDNYDHVYKLENTGVEEIADMFVEAGFSGESNFTREADVLTAQLYFYDSDPANQNAKYTLEARNQFYVDAADDVSTKSDLVSMVSEIYTKDVESGGYTFFAWG